MKNMSPTKTPKPVPTTNRFEELPEEMSEEEHLVLLSKGNAKIAGDLESLRSTVDSMNESIAKLLGESEEVRHLKETQQKILADMHTLRYDSLALFIKTNELEMRDRMFSTKVHNLKLDSNKCYSQQIYTTLIKPALELALQEKVINSIPEWFIIMDTAHPLPVKKEGDIPTVQFKLLSRDLQKIYLHYSKEVLKKINRNRKVKVTQGPDLTESNSEVMSRLINKGARAWVSHHNIYWRSTDGRKHKVFNPYGLTESEIAKKVKGPRLHRKRMNKTVTNPLLEDHQDDTSQDEPQDEPQQMSAQDGEVPFQEVKGKKGKKNTPKSNNTNTSKDAGPTSNKAPSTASPPHTRSSASKSKAEGEKDPTQETIQDDLGQQSSPQTTDEQSRLSDSQLNADKSPPSTSK